MLHPSYSDLMKVVNSEVEPGEAPIVNSRYSIVMATSKRARQLISNDWDPLIDSASDKPLSTAVQELYEGKIKIMTEEEARRTREFISLSESEDEAEAEAEEGADVATEDTSEDTSAAEGEEASGEAEEESTEAAATESAE
jgi:DNA-directed RNA polymerase subunit omega